MDNDGRRRGGWGRGRGQGRGGRRGRGRGGGQGNPPPGVQPANHGLAQEGEEGTGGLGNNGRGRGQARQDRKRYIGYHKLVELQSEEPSDLLMILTNSRNGFKELLSSLTIKPDWIKLILALVAKACTSLHSPQLLIQLLSIIKDSAFLHQHLTMYIIQMQVETSVHKMEEFKESLQHMLKLLKMLLLRLPEASITAVLGLLAVLESAFKGLRPNSNIIDEDLDILLVEVTSLSEEIVKNKREGNAQANLAASALAMDDVVPPDDFRNVPVFPSLDDIDLKEKPFLRANKDRGGYKDANHYLDVQFRLLREDFVQPLRNGIRQYKETGSTNPKDLRFLDVKIYLDVHVMNPVCTVNGLLYRIRFDVSKLKKIKWQATKRLIYGSLVCLSDDQFNTMLFATVANRKPKDLEKGFLEVRFEHKMSEIHTISPTTSFVMAETSAYFEAYRHVLLGLQHTTDDEFPFEKYIVSCQSEVAPPNYLLRARGMKMVTFDMSPLVEDPSVRPLYLQDGIVENGSDFPLYSTETESLSKVPVLNTLRWPSSEKLHLDGSQLKALKTALTKEFAVIQGPPGTGKTYIGLKIAQALIHNKGVWGADTPILVVCYTNHALDQFLEGIHTFMESGIVRVGGRSKSEVLEKFLIRNLKDEMRQNKKVPRAVFEGINDARSEMKAMEEKIQQIVALIEQTERGIIHEEKLSPVISDAHYDSLINPRQVQDQAQMLHPPSKKNARIIDWLGLGDIPYSANRGRGDEEQAAVKSEEEEEDGEEEGIDVEEEADILQDQRIIDDEEPEEGWRWKNKFMVDDRDLALDLSQLSLLDFGREDDGEAQAGWEIQKPLAKKRKRQLQQGLLNKDTMSDEEAHEVDDVWTLSGKDRWRLYHWWVARYCALLKENIEMHELPYEEASERMKEVRNQQDLVILKEAVVIGMTTTGAAKYQSILQEIQPKIVIVEEAAEVLEAHIVTTLSKSCEHLILIGDHKQLRPSTTVYRLAKDYNLDISLFERMINNGVNVDCLQFQHRMRPEIATLVRHIYPELKNHASVEGLEDIKGIAKNLFFIDHNHPEVSNEETKSRSNEHEAKFLTALCKYILLQGYKASQITILTPYTGQLFKFKRMMPKEEFEGVRVSSVDNFQGEENDIILLSLVRSESLGFLAIQNRVCVALSRAKKGLYVMGNASLLSGNDMWKKIIEDLEASGSYGDALPLYCQNHKMSQIMAKGPGDFMEAPEGGCMLPCEYRLPCGHSCKKACHTYDREHKKQKCFEPCGKKICENGHRCKRLCHQECGECKEKVLKVLPVCGHVERIGCSDNPFLATCTKPCKEVLSCGHRCSNRCGEKHTQRCEKVQERTWPCSHIVKTHCYQTPESFPCPEQCGQLLDCGHMCPGTCGTCKQGRLHVQCSHKCGRTLVCGHGCEDTCTKNCPPCRRPCENRCVHSKCHRSCGEPCAPCLEPCAWTCKHHACRKLCSEPCDRPPCNKPCDRKLRCGHKCIGLCGEPCPEKCRVCDKDEVTQIFFGTEDEADARFVQLQDCMHFFEVSGLDQWFATDTTSDTNKVTDIQLKCCPMCKKPIRRNLRYGKHINARLADIESVKRKMAVDPDDILATRRHLQQEMSADDSELIVELNQTFEEMVEKGTVSHDQLALIKNQINIIKRISALKRKFQDERTPGKPSISLRDVIKELTSLSEWVTQPRSRMSEQEASQLNAEISRVASLGNWFVISGIITSSRNPLPAETQRRFVKVKIMLNDRKPFTEKREKIVKSIYTEVKKACPVSALGITETERFEIVKAMGMSQGHWFKCPNGHVYAIGDCGGAMEESTCPECNSRIGGQSHRLLDTNRVASEMDGARYAAWSEEANNMGNYDF